MTPDFSQDSMQWLRMDDLLTDAQRAVRSGIQEYVDRVVRPGIDAAWSDGRFPRDLVEPMASLGILGSRLTQHGCAGLDAVSLGLVRYELSRGDGSIGTFFGVHSGLAMGSIGRLGSDAQQARWLPPMTRLECIGAFALSEPGHGSDASGLATRARRETRDGRDVFVLNGTKRWIGNAPIADLLIVWARGDDDRIGGFVVEQPSTTPGVTITPMEGKIAKRAVPNGVVQLEDVVVPLDARLERSRGFGDVANVLLETRYTVAWEAAGIAAACFEAALAHTRTREQFGRPLASFQLVQRKLADMAADVTAMQCVCLRLGQLLEQGHASAEQISLAKYRHAERARDVARNARDLLGADGLLVQGPVARLLMDAEAVVTYEGTSEINLLIAARALTGLSAFS